MSVKECELEAQEAETLKQHELALALEEFKAEEARKMRNAECEKREEDERQRERDYELHLQLQERQHTGDMERTEAQRSARPVPAPREKVRARTPKKKPRFQNVRMRWTHTCWGLRDMLQHKDGIKALGLQTSALLQGKALDVYALMPKEDALDYEKLKCALLKRYKLTEEGFKRRYKKCRPESGETFHQFTTRMNSYFTRWIDMSRIEKTFENLQDLILRDQLTFLCNKDVELFLGERQPKSFEQASRLADLYKEARYVDIVSLTFNANDRSKPRSNSNSRSRSPSPGGQQMAGEVHKVTR